MVGPGVAVFVRGVTDGSIVDVEGISVSKIGIKSSLMGEQPDRRKKIKLTIIQKKVLLSIAILGLLFFIS